MADAIDKSPTTGEQFYNRVAQMREMGRRSALDLVGKRFGRLVVTARAGTQNRKAIWNCRCDCGTEKIVLGQSLVREATVSCGCYHREIWKNVITNPNLTDEDRQFERSFNPSNAEWRTKVYEHDSYRCVVCEDGRGGNLVAHHKDGYHWCKKRRYDVSNGATTCVACHKDFHSMYGQENNTEKQWMEFMAGTRPNRRTLVIRSHVDISGQKFGSLLVISRSGSAKDGHALFLCRCECGNIKVLAGKKLRSGEVKSCGCMKGKLISQSKRKAA